MITVVDYDPAWPGQFMAAREVLFRALTDRGVPVTSIEHIGSTAVPGLAARAVIDCDVVVADSFMEDTAQVVSDLGFTSLGDQGIPGRLAFESPPGWEHVAVYVVDENSLCLRDHLAVRDTLRSSPQLCRRLADIKKEVASRTSDIFEYAYGKDSTMKEILARSGLSQEERDVISTHRVRRPDESA